MEPFLWPLPRAICKLLYTFCKVRGPKVISRFFDNEARNLEPMLDAFQLWSQARDDDSNKSEQVYARMSWEEKYIMMLWLSHLLLTPFDLSTIGSVGTLEDEDLPQGVTLPSSLPEITIKLIAIALKHLTSAGKHRDASVALLVRLALRPDMQKLGLHDSLIQWAVASFDKNTSDASSKGIYDHIGTLSFLAGIINSGDADAIEPYLLYIFKCVRKLNAEESQVSKDIVSSALDRKVIIKIMRSISITAIQIASHRASNVIEFVLEPVIDHLLNSLSDKDTPVRYAASKAIGMITIKLEPEMATEIADAAVGSLEENMLWEDVEDIVITDATGIREQSKKSHKERDLSAVNALQWQGLTLTLSHLLFRRSPSPSQLPQILNSLILALGFEQRSSSGNSIGTNVRDAACFGIWSLARRYTTDELLAVDTSSVRVAKVDEVSISIIQVLAMALVVAATVDPSGNIRRGASAALQELVGRHPNTIAEGISLVQIVDYHAVARRSRALKEVAIAAAGLDDLYWTEILNELLKWRGISSPDVDSRRLAAEAVGILASTRSIAGIATANAKVWQDVSHLKHREVEKRHGLLLTASSLVHAAKDLSDTSLELKTSALQFWDAFKLGFLLEETDFTSSIRRPELTAEATCSLISTLSSVTASDINLISPSIINNCASYINLSLGRREESTIQHASQASKYFFSVLPKEQKQPLLDEWLQKAERSTSRSGGGGLGHLAALGVIYSNPDISSSSRIKILDLLISSLGGGSDIETRIAALRVLNEGILPSGGEHIPLYSISQVRKSDSHYSSNKPSNPQMHQRLPSGLHHRPPW